MRKTFLVFFLFQSLAFADSSDDLLLKRLLNKGKLQEARSFLKLRQALIPVGPRQIFNDYLLQALIEAQLGNNNASQKNLVWARRALENCPEFVRDPKLRAQGLADLEMTQFDAKALSSQ